MPAGKRRKKLLLLEASGAGREVDSATDLGLSHGNYKKPVNFFALSFEGESWQSLKTLNVLHLLKRIFQNAVFLRKDLLGAVTFLEVSWNFLAAKALPSVLRCLSHTLHCSAH